MTQHAYFHGYEVRSRYETEILRAIERLGGQASTAAIKAEVDVDWQTPTTSMGPTQHVAGRLHWLEAAGFVAEVDGLWKLLI